MKFEPKEISLKDGRKALLRSPTVDDAQDLLNYLKQTAGETPFLLRTPEECNMSVEEEVRFIENMSSSEFSLMILCTVDGRIAGNCQLSRKTKIRNRHRGTIGIALIREFWNLGIGTAMFRELISLGMQWGLSQLELEVIEGNHRAMALYEKMGFQTVAAHPDAIRLEDGTVLKEFLMVKKL